MGIRTWRGISTAADGLADPDPGASMQRGNGSVDEVEQERQKSGCVDDAALFCAFWSGAFVAGAEAGGNVGEIYGNL